MSRVGKGRVMERLRWGGWVYVALACLGVLAAASGPATAEEVPGVGLALPEGQPAEPAEAEWPVSFAFDATYASKYVWRGMVVTEDPVFEPSVEVGFGDLTLNVWANMDTTDVNDFDNQFNEIDFTLDYSTAWKWLNFSVGAIDYVFPQAHTFDTTEAYLAIGADVLTSPTLTVYQDLDEHDGQYITLGFGHTFEDVWKPTEGVSMSVDLGATCAWGSRKHNEFYYGPGSGWADTTVILGTPFAIGDHLTITPYVSYMWIVDDDITGALGRDDAFWAGLSVTVSF